MINFKEIKEPLLNIGDECYHIEGWENDFELKHSVVVGLNAYTKAGSTVPKIKYSVVDKNAADIMEVKTLYGPAFLTKEEAVKYKIDKLDQSMERFINEVNIQVEKFERSKLEFSLLLKEKGGR